MAYPVVESVSTATIATSNAITITKPSGLAVGNLMVAGVLSGIGVTTRTWSPPAGWSGVQSSAQEFSNLSVYTKVADSGDVAASNFTFTLSGTWAGYTAGSILRISGVASVGSSEKDSEYPPSSATFSYTANTAALSPESLAVLVFGQDDLTLAATATYSAYTITPSATLTERVDVGNRDGSSDGLTLAIATAPVTNATITAYGATASEVSDRQRAGILLVLNGVYSASADISHISITPSAESLESSNTATADVSHINITPNIESLDSKSSSDDTQWITNTKPSATYNNTAKPSATWSNDAKPAISWTNPDK